MALLKDLIVYGASRFIGDVLGSQIYGKGFHHNAHDTDTYFLLAGGGAKALSTIATNEHNHNGSTARTAWGQQYVNASGTLTSISGNMSSVGNIIPSGNNAQNIGSATNRWAKLYIGTADSYGSATKGIYWDAGVPKACTVAINSGTTNKIAYYSDNTTISSWTSTTGGTVQPIYLNAGVPTALSGSVGGAATPVYLNAGTITKCSSTVGSGTQPVYMSGGQITVSSSTVGSGTQFVFLSGGVITKTTSTVGSSTKPIYLNAGVITECSSMATSGHTHSIKLGGTTITVPAPGTTPTATTSITGPFAINTEADSSKAFSIQRGGPGEGVKHWVDDSIYHIEYTNDEKSSTIQLRLINTDTENPSNPPQTSDFCLYLTHAGYFHPEINNTGSIGTSSCKWNYIYATNIYGNLTGNVTGNLTGIADWAKLLKPISTTTTASASTWNIPSGCKQVWGERFSDNTLKYTPSGGSATTITDTGDWVIWLEPNATSNVATLNMSIDGTYYGSFSGSLSGNASTATKLATARTINGTSFDGTANITTANWGTARNISIADSDSTNTGTAVSVNGSAAVTLKLPSTIKATLTGNASSATKLQTARTINGTSFDGTANITTANWGTARNISIADSDSTNTGTAVSVNGSAAVTLKLPSTIKATLTGNASSATKLQTARNLKVNLASANAQSFDGSADATNIGVAGILPYANLPGLYIATTKVQSASTAGQNITGTGNITSNTNLTYSLGSSSLRWKYTYSQILNSALTDGTRTKAGGDQGSSANPRYFPEIWTFNSAITPANGDIITIKTPGPGHDYGIFLSVNNGTNYYPITLGGTGRMTTHYGTGTYLILLFDSSNSAASMFALAGQNNTSRVTISGGTWRVLNYYDSGNSGDWNLRQYNIKAAAAIDNTHIIGGTDSGYKNIDAGNAFDIRYPVLWAGSNIASGSAGSNNYIHHYAVNFRNSSNSTIGGLTAYKNVYIKGTISGTVFTPINNTNPYVQDITASDDGYVYYYIGRAYASNAITFDGTGKDIYIYKDGKIQRYVGNADLLDGIHASGLLSAFSGGGITSSGNTLTQTNHSITIGGTTKTAGASTANIINSLSVSKLTSSSTTNLTAAITINGVASSDKTLTDLWARYLANLYSSRQASMDVSFGDGSLRKFVATSTTTTGKPTIGDAHIIHSAWDNTGGYDAQIAIGTSGGMQYRYQSGGTWQAWRTLIDSDNYTSYVNNYYWANIKVSTTSNTSTTPQFGKVGINTALHSSYILHVGGDSYATGWSRAGSGFYCEGTGVHFTHNGNHGEINIINSNEFLLTGSATTMYFNYRAASRGTTPTTFIWNAGSSTTYAIHKMKSIELFPTDNTSYTEGLRIHVASNNWATIALCGADNTGASGTSANTWGIFNNNGTFAIAKNNSAYNSACGMGNSGGVWYFNNRILIDATGRIKPLSTSTRRAGMYGVYDSTKLGHIWSMGTDYMISDNGADPATLYGLAYFHTNWSNNATYNTNAANKTAVGTYAGDHQCGWFINGVLKASMGSYVWSAGGFIKAGSSINYVLTGNGGHKKWSEGYEVSTIVARNASGQIYCSHLNTTSNDMDSTAFTKVFVSNDNWIRYVTKVKFVEALREEDTVSFDKSLTVTEAWMDTGIVVNTTNFPKGSGTYAIQISHANLTTPGTNGYASLYSGIISIYTDGTNSTTDSEEIILHRAGHAWVNRIYIRTMPVAATGNCKIQIAASKTWTAASNVTFKFRKLI